MTDDHQRPVLAPLATHEALSNPSLTELIASVRQIAMQRDLLGLATVASRAATRLAGGARGRCYFFDADTATLWNDEGMEFHSAYGIVGAAVQTRWPRVTERAHFDPAYWRAVDDPEGSGTERLLVVPIVSSCGEVHAVVIVARHPTLEPFSSSDIALLRLWAEQAAPLFHMLHLEGLAARAQLASEVVGHAALYREDAIAHVMAGNPDLGPVVGAIPWSLRHAYLFVIAAFAVAIAVLGFVPVDEYARGPAVIVSTGVHDVTATRGGVVETVLFEPGDRVEAGQLLATLSAESERAELERTSAELERAVLSRLRRPAEPGLDVAVADATVARDRAAAQVEAASIRSRTAGRVGDHRVEVGRSVAAGDVVMTMLDDGDAAPVIRALVPGRHRPALEVGQPLMLDLDGFADARQRLTITAISEEVVGVTEMRRIAGAQLADALALEGPAAVVEVRLEDDMIVADGRAWVLREGMTGRASVSVRRRPLLMLLFPQLEGLIDRV